MKSTTLIEALYILVEHLLKILILDMNFNPRHELLKLVS